MYRRSKMKSQRRETQHLESLSSDWPSLLYFVDLSAKDVWLGARLDSLCHPLGGVADQRTDDLRLLSFLLY